MSGAGSAEVVVAGHYGDRNLGDIAISQVLAGFLEEHGKRGRVRVVVFRDGNFGCPTVDVRRAKALTRLLSSFPKLIVIGGGGILQNATSTANLALHFLVALLGRALRVRVVLAGVGIGPLRGRLARALARWTVRLATGGCLVRDVESLAFAEEYSIAKPFLAPDLAFALRVGESVDRKRLAHLWLSLRPPVGAARKRLQPDDAYLDRLAGIVSVVRECAVARGLEVGFLAMHPIQDMLVWEKLCSRLSGASTVECIAVDSPRVLAAHIQPGDVVIGMRLHALIFASLRGAAYVALGYDKKLLWLTRQMGMEDFFLESRQGEVDLGVLRRVLGACLDQREEIGRRLGVLARDYSNEAKRLLGRLFYG